MTDQYTGSHGHNSRGAVIKLFGVILIILGALNTMLSWRGGFEVLSLPVIFIATGMLLCLVGTILRNTASRIQN